MSHVHSRRLQAIRNEFSVLRGAVQELRSDWPRRCADHEWEPIPFQHVQEAERNLENTYIVRLFSEFEAVLEDYLLQFYPGTRLPGTAEALIDRVARRRRISDPIRDEAHTARKYRNSVVHQRAAGAAFLTFAHALSRLNHFVARLPD